jgi:F0F1-type ATP synthase membrane subunit b/b'
MTDEAERFAQESLHSQKQLADSEQKREEFKIQAQETIKQLNKIYFY